MPDTKPPYDAPLGRVASGLYILTLGGGEKATGMLASWAVQAGFEPPMVSVAVKLGRHACERLTAGEPFVLNLVGEGQTDFLKHFGRGFEPGEPAFEGIATTPCPRGVPVLSAALGHLECEPGEHLDSGDHRVFLARVVRGSMSGEGEPMVHVRKSGAHY
ncbi:putative diflavin flavoprotein A 3 [Pseudobythopirellula maris]|uniref:Putative diflavin flavoprotein A 3 n=1 Tax=Pseudobythopirellula maris TaxID=2527991 RepID=A0A5C5ZQ49_9BACT|nr:flavin reductase family protein [Pseudobythopirellula maris]TWT88463.1 putative diflavin flavoprotein A 3 [Pseudobythopirellula maris]